MDIWTDYAHFFNIHSYKILYYIHLSRNEKNETSGREKKLTKIQIFITPKKIKILPNLFYYFSCGLC